MKEVEVVASTPQSENRGFKPIELDKVDASQPVVPAANAAGTVSAAPVIDEEGKRLLQQQKFEQEHPWVMDANWYNNYQKVNPGQWTNDAMQYWNMTGQRPDDWLEQIIDARTHGTLSKKEDKRNKRIAAWQDMLTGVGDVLAHFVNYKRTQGGDPAYTVPENRNPSQLDRLRAADEALRQQGFTERMNAMMQRQRRNESLEDMRAKHQLALEQERVRMENKRLLKQMDMDTPEYQMKLKKMGIDLAKAEDAKEISEMKKEREKLISMGFEKKQADEAVLRELNLKLKRKQLAKPDGGTTPKPYSYNGKTYSSAYSAYKDAAIASGKKVVDAQHFNKAPGKYLDEVGVEYEKK